MNEVFPYTSNEQLQNEIKISFTVAPKHDTLRDNFYQNICHSYTLKFTKALLREISEEKNKCRHIPCSWFKKNIKCD